tara:strand:- start:133 stop:468 length:336 start_codon:yes stop_codon:yes gene_type:complete
MSLNENSFRPSRQEFGRASSGGQTRDPGDTSKLLKQHKTEGTKGKVFTGIGIGLGALAIAASGGLATPLVGTIATVGSGLAGMGAQSTSNKQAAIQGKLASAPNPTAMKDY